MKVFLVCAFVLAAVGAVKSAPPRKPKFCCYPQQYEASLSQVSGFALSNGKGMVSNSLLILAVDSKNERTAANVTQTVNGNTIKLKVITNYKEKVQYVINGETCTKSVMNVPPLNCIPDNAQFAGSFYFGDKKLVSSMYSFPLKQMGIFEGNVSMTVTQDKCIPVSSVSVGMTMESPAPSLPVLMDVGVFNFTTGIKDPTHWFTLPSFCPRGISEVSEGSVDSDPVPEFMTLSNVMMRYTADV